MPPLFGTILPRWHVLYGLPTNLVERIAASTRLQTCTGSGARDKNWEVVTWAGEGVGIKVTQDEICHC